MNIEECIREGLLQETRPDKRKAQRSLESAKHKLERAKELFQEKFFEEAIIAAYTSMFHAARALLFRGGYKERSHYALGIYIKEVYGDKIEKKYIHELNTLRMQRHDLMYGLGESQELHEAEAESAISAAAGFLEAVKSLL